MSFIVDFLAEALFGLFGEGFIYLCSAFVPNKTLSYNSQQILGIVFSIIALVLFCGMIVGVILLIETGGKSFWGWILVCLGIIYIISGIVLKLISRIKK